VFQENMKLIRQHNSKKGITYTMGLGPWTDFTNEEYRKQLTFRATNPQGRTVVKPDYDFSKPLPTSFDWRDHGAVGEIKDQGQCGSCWSFSAVGTITGAHQIATSNLVELSEQNIIDCSWIAPYNNTGCDGGDMRTALQYVIDNHGIDTEDSYQYQDINGGDREDCFYRLINRGAQIRAMIDVIEGNETDLAYAAWKCPVSIGIDASQPSFQNYQDGIYYEGACGNTIDDIDHGVTVVGFANDDDGDYWIVKNSWGDSWGMSGYILMARDDDNQCGVATYATVAVV